MEPHDGPDAHRLHQLAGAAAEQRCRKSTRSSCPPPPRWAWRSRARTTAWPDDDGEATLPDVQPYDDAASAIIEVFNRGQAPFDYSIEVGRAVGARRRRSAAATRRQRKQQRLWVSVDWDASAGGRSARADHDHRPERQAASSCTAVVDNAAHRSPSDIRGFVEADGYVSIEAEHFSRRRRRRADPLAAHSRPGPHALGMTPCPSTAASADAGRRQPAPGVPRASVRRPATVKVQAYRLADAQFPQQRRACATPCRSTTQPPQIVNIHADENRCRSGRSGSPTTSTFRRPKHHDRRAGRARAEVLDGRSGRRAAEAGRRRPASLPPSYLGPPESTSDCAAQTRTAAIATVD